MSDNPKCNFCGTSSDHVKLMIASNQNTSGQIHATCDECGVRHVEILATENVAVRNELIALLRKIEPINSN